MMGIFSSMLMLTSCETAMAVLAGMADGMSGYGYGTGYGWNTQPAPSSYSGGSYSSSSSSFSSSSSSSMSSSSSSSGSSARKCAYCSGTGRVKKYYSVATYGQTETKKKCEECGSYYYPSNGHTHVNCGHCGGTGIAR